MEEKTPTPLTWDDVESEIVKVKSFFEQLPRELRPDAAEKLIFEIVNWASYNHYEALGIFMESMLQYRETSLRVMAEEAAEEENKDD